MVRNKRVIVLICILAIIILLAEIVEYNFGVMNIYNHCIQKELNIGHKPPRIPVYWFLKEVKFDDLDCFKAYSFPHGNEKSDSEVFCVLIMENGRRNYELLKQSAKNNYKAIEDDTLTWGKTNIVKACFMKANRKSNAYFCIDRDLYFLPTLLNIETGKESLLEDDGKNYKKVEILIRSIVNQSP